MASWRVMIALLFFAKLLTTTLNRGVYPFADYFAEELGVSRASFFFILSAGEFSGFLAPVFGTLLAHPPVSCCPYVTAIHRCIR